MMALLNWVDYGLIGVIVFFTLYGFVRGFMREVLAFITLVAAVALAGMYTTQFSEYLMGLSSVKSIVASSSDTVGKSTEEIANYLLLAFSFTALFVAVSIVGGIVSWLVNAVLVRGSLGVGNRFMGGIFGCVKGALINLIIIFVIQLTPISAEAWWGKSQVVKYYEPVVTQLAEFVSPTLKNVKSAVSKAVEKAGDAVSKTSKAVSDQVQGAAETVSSGDAKPAEAKPAEAPTEEASDNGNAVAN